MRNSVFLAPHLTFVFIDSHVSFIMYSMHFAVPMFAFLSSCSLDFVFVTGFTFQYPFGGS